MFEVGFSELLLIFAIALVVLGPQKLPKLAQQVGKWVGRARAMARQFREQLEDEAHNFESKMSVDPGIDTSLEPKPGAPSGAASNPGTPNNPGAADAGAAPAPAAPPAAAPVEEQPEEFYPPDHHMHSSHRNGAPSEQPHDSAQASPSAAAPADSHGGAQGELDLSAPADDRQPRSP